MSRSSLGRLWSVCCLVCVAGCATSNSGGLFGTPSPHEAYARQLEQSGLGATALGRDWTSAGARALQAPADVATPFMESGYMAADTPAALAYRLTLTRGRRLVVDVQVDGLQPARVFVDLFELREDAAPKRVASLEDQAQSLSFEVRRDGVYVLRVQPELLRDVRVTVTQRTESTLGFPVAGLTAQAVQSGFGAARDGGTRGHEGVDIFAPRGTPVAAVTDGVARTATNGLGGNVVWLRGDGRRFYYAHLDRWAIDGTARVSTGDVLGYVGNTGNARTTSPHLHFGIYEQGAIDPLPLLQPDDPPPGPPESSPDLLGRLVRVTRVRTPLREGAGRRAAAVADLQRATVARVVGLAEGAVRLVLPDRVTGYVDAAAVTLADATPPVRRMQLEAGIAVRAAPSPSAPVVTTIDAGVAVDVLGEFDGHALVRMATRQTGWVAR